MNSKTVKREAWLVRALETHKFHSQQKRELNGWRVQDTAKELERSVGAISEDLLIIKWYKTHQEIIDKFDYVKDCLAWIRKKEHESSLEIVE